MNLEMYTTRLRELDDIISLLAEVNAIKTKIENSEAINGVEEIFSNIEVMGMSEHSSKDWETAKRKFEVKIEGAEKEISRFLKSRVISIAKLKEKPIKSFK